MIVIIPRSMPEAAHLIHDHKVHVLCIVDELPIKLSIEFVKSMQPMDPGTHPPWMEKFERP